MTIMVGSMAAGRQAWRCAGAETLYLMHKQGSEREREREKGRGTVRGERERETGSVMSF